MSSGKFDEPDIELPLDFYWMIIEITNLDWLH